MRDYKTAVNELRSNFDRLVSDGLPASLAIVLAFDMTPPPQDGADKNTILRYAQDVFADTSVGQKIQTVN